MITAAIQSNLDRFNATFQKYAATWTARGHGTLDDALEKKGRDLGIQLYNAFKAHKWGGPGKHRGLARAELDARSAEGKGIKVRHALLAEYYAARARLNRRMGPFTEKAHSKLIRVKVKLWQSFVGHELKLRQKGIGVLAASFLWYRTRRPQSGAYYVKNRTRETIGTVEKGEGFFRIIGDVEGQSVVDVKYGVVASAIAASETDMLQYFRNIKIKEQFEAAMASAA